MFFQACFHVILVRMHPAAPSLQSTKAIQDNGLGRPDVIRCTTLSLRTLFSYILSKRAECVCRTTGSRDGLLRPEFREIQNHDWESCVSGRR
jgi:hypothetical protein